MPYKTTKRASTAALNGFTREKTQDVSAFLAIPSAKCGEYEYTINIGTPNVSSTVYPLYPHSGNYGVGSLGGVVGEQTTYSWRTGKNPGVQNTYPSGDMSGPTMRRALLAGFDVSMEPGDTGVDRLRDRKGFTPFGGSDYDSEDNGHDFWTSKTVRNHMVAAYTQPYSVTITKENPVARSRETLRWWGAAPVLKSSLSWPAFSNPTDAYLRSAGQRMFKASSPTRSHANVVRSIGETIKDGLPSLIGISALKDGARRGAGGEYLNYQFGIAPVVSDLRNLSTAAKDSEKILKQFRRDNGKWIRRTNGWSEDPQNVSFTLTSPTIGWGARLSSPSGASLDLTRFLDSSTATRQVSASSVLTVDHRFVGSYSYMTPGITDGVIDRFGYYVSQADHLLGLSFDADTAYDLIPFSWMLDWVVDFGSVFDNAVLLSNDHLVAKYAYSMCHKKQQRTAILTGLLDVNLQPLPAVIVHDETISHKSRTRASPYGFNVTLDGLTGYQKSILAALGLSARLSKS